ncbi:hypothetical protein EYF80_034603 [Liparis tanakae]|uniref:Uncharacterized protein n=1 Tax=Liparis tanakae TaxID=230148 RepID=A0A4Z2GNE5_9TELE|nr:hypothetical protein EYF80_034603 [Liparis tanakae]
MKDGSGHVLEASLAAPYCNAPCQRSEVRTAPRGSKTADGVSSGAFKEKEVRRRLFSPRSSHSA